MLIWINSLASLWVAYCVGKRRDDHPLKASTQGEDTTERGGKLKRSREFCPFSYSFFSFLTSSLWWCSLLLLTLIHHSWGFERSCFLLPESRFKVAGYQDSSHKFDTFSSAAAAATPATLTVTNDPKNTVLKNCETKSLLQNFHWHSESEFSYPKMKNETFLDNPELWNTVQICFVQLKF